LKNAVIIAAAAAASSTTTADRSTGAAYVRALTRAEDLTYRLPRDSISAAYPSRPGTVGQAPSTAASGQTSISSNSSTHTDAAAPTDAQTRARARSSPTFNWIPFEAL